MSFNIHFWLNELVVRLKATFGPRLKAVGLQGSFRRGEETPQSDIDAVVILDLISPQDITAYKTLLAQMPPTDSHPVCGFFGGEEELKNWPRSELFQFSYDTEILYGSLEGIIKPPTRQDALACAQILAGNIYHSLVHTWVHGELTPVFLQELCKISFFMLQAVHFVRTGSYVPSKKELINTLINIQERQLIESSVSKITPAKIPSIAGNLLKCCQKILIFGSGPNVN